MSNRYPWLYIHRHGLQTPAMQPSGFCLQGPAEVHEICKDILTMIKGERLDDPTREMVTMENLVHGKEYMVPKRRSTPLAHTLLQIITSLEKKSWSTLVETDLESSLLVDVITIHLVWRTSWTMLNFLHMTRGIKWPGLNNWSWQSSMSLANHQKNHTQEH